MQNAAFLALPIPTWVVATALAVLAIIKANTIKAGLTWVWQHIRPDAPSLTVEIRDTSLDAKVASLDTDFAGYTIDAYLFFNVWVVNTNRVPATVKSWVLKLKSEGAKYDGEFVPDISKWHHIERKRGTAGGFKVTTDVRTKLDTFGPAPFTQGVPMQGWVCFLIRNVKPDAIESAKVELTLIDSFGRKHRVKTAGPWTENNTVNPDIPW